MNRDPKSEANKILEHVCKYIQDAGWEIDFPSFLWVDPVTKSKHRTDFAFVIQTSRDLECDGPDLFYIFYRAAGWYPLELANDDAARANAEINIGTVKVEHLLTGRIVWPL